MGEHAIVIVIGRINPNCTGRERQMGHYFIVLIRASQISNSPVETIAIQKKARRLLIQRPSMELGN